MVVDRKGDLPVSVLPNDSSYYKGQTDDPYRPPRSLSSQSVQPSLYAHWEVVPNPHRLRVEIRTVENGETELQEGVQQQGRKGQLVGLIVESMIGSRVPGE